MLVYHVSLNEMDNLVKEFIPRIPWAAADDEDIETPRICVSPSIIGCFTGIGYDSAFEVGASVIVYEAVVPDNWLVPPEMLVEYFGVHDAMYTQEHWCMHPITMIGHRYRVVGMERDNYILPKVNPEAVEWIRKKFGAVTEGLSEHVLLNEFIWAQGLDEDDLQEMFDIKGIRVFTKMQLEVVYEEVAR